MRVKLKLTPEEIRDYNGYKRKMLRARTRTELSLYKQKAQAILDNGKNRYIRDLENKNGHTHSVNL